MGKLTTHVLDTTHGKPGNAITVTLYRIEGDSREKLKRVLTNDDGRCDEPLLEAQAFSVGIYELVFAVGPYFAAQADDKADVKPASSAPLFLDDVVIRFGVGAADQHYHVPLLISPYSYSTYRGS